MKAKAKVYKGIEFIRVSELPANQQLLLEHAREPERIKILMDGQILANCIQYREYSIWFATVFERSVSVSATKTLKEEEFPVKIVLSKA